MSSITVCFFDDVAGLEARDRIGIRQIAFETDYPHQDSTWPDSRPAIERFAPLLDDEELALVLRGNAARLLGIGD